MRYLLAILMTVFLAHPAFAEPALCSLDAPYKCGAQNDESLLVLTHEASSHMNIQIAPGVSLVQGGEYAQHSTSLEPTSPKRSASLETGTGHEESLGFLAILAFLR